MARLLQILGNRKENRSSIASDLEHMVNAMIAPACVLDGRSEVVHANEAWSALLAPLQLKLRLTQQDVRLEDGKWVRLTVNPMGSCGLHLCIANDISDLKDSPIKLPYRQMLDVFSDCVKVVDTSGRLLFVNKAGRGVLSLGEEQPLGMRWTDLLPEPARPKVESVLEQVFAGEIAEFSNRSQFPGKETETWHHILTPYRDSDGRVAAVICVSRNISSEFNNYEDSRKQEERLALATRAGGFGLWDLDLLTGQLKCDALFYQVAGIDPQRAVTTIEDFMTLVHPDDHDRMRRDWTERRLDEDARTQYRMKFKLAQPDGSYVPVLVMATIVRDLTDQPVRAIGLLSREMDFEAGSDT